MSWPIRSPHVVAQFFSVSQMADSELIVPIEQVGPAEFFFRRKLRWVNHLTIDTYLHKTYIHIPQPLSKLMEGRCAFFLVVGVLFWCIKICCWRHFRGDLRRDFVLGLTRRDWARLGHVYFKKPRGTIFHTNFGNPATKYLIGPLKLQVIESQSKPLSTK